jgi:hypothetical protein
METWNREELYSKVWEALPLEHLLLIGQEQRAPRRPTIRIVVFRKMTLAAFQIKPAIEGISPSLCQTGGYQNPVLLITDVKSFALVTPDPRAQIDISSSSSGDYGLSAFVPRTVLRRDRRAAPHH